MSDVEIRQRRMIGGFNDESTGVLYPAAQLAMGKDGQLQIELNQNAWKLVDVIDWPSTPGVN